MFDSFQSIDRFGRYIEGQGLKLSRTMHGVLQAVSGIVQYAFFPRLGLRAVSCQRLIACADLPLIPIRELGAPSCLRRSKSCGEAAHHVAALVMRYRRDGICRPQQAIAGRGEWSRAHGSFDPTHDWSCRSGLVVCVLIDEYRFGWELRIRDSCPFSWCWCVRFGAASTERMDA
ncbi:hypothetical protein EDB83DRAFT_1844958 [Lactarius deliciosus]|nr:hypothetical protein EDB83DRAFT_1844958 [Lactarius deliciosus]